MHAFALTSHGRILEEAAIRQIRLKRDHSVSVWRDRRSSQRSRETIMHRQVGLVSGCLGAALLVLGPVVLGADSPKRLEPSEVVMKSLDTNLVVDGRVVDTRHEFLRYRVEKVQGDWLWLVADCGRRGWAHRRDVVPVDQAIAYFGELIEREPRSARAHYMRGMAHLVADEHRQAIHDVSAAIRLDPSYSPAYVDRGYAKLGKRDVNGALADANEAVRLDPKSARPYQCRGYVLQKKEQYKQAIEDYDTAIRLDPNDGMLFVYRAHCWSEQRDNDRAIADASAAIRLEPTLTWAYRLRSKYWGNKQDYDRELEDASAVVRLNPKSPSAYIIRAGVWWDTDNFARALADCDEAIRLDPKDPGIHLVRGILLANKGEFGPAFRELIFHPMLRPTQVKYSVPFP
jgi:tetratricopeptide (TPR) repeat protein